MRNTLPFSSPEESGIIRGYHPYTGYRYSGPTQIRYQYQEDDNHEEIGEFIFNNIFWMLIAMVWYRGLLFRCLEHQTLSTSKLILWGLVLASTFLGIILEIKHHRKSLNVFFNVVIGYGIYTAITYAHIRPDLIKAVLIGIFLAVSVFFILLYMIRWHNFRVYRRSISLKYRSMVVTAQKVAGIGFAIIITVTGSARIFDSTLLKATVPPANEQNIEEQTIENNMETLVALYDGSWSALTAREKLNVLQTVANIEQRYLGLPHELNVEVEDQDGNTAGTYNDETHEILISTKCLLYDSPWELVNTICHEAYHAYQHRLVDLWNHADEDSRGLKIFRRVRSYAEEFQNYVGTEDDFYTYYIQRCESDARDYADDAERDYYWKIRDYWGPEEEQDNSFTVPSLEKLFGTSTAEQDQN